MAAAETQTPIENKIIRIRAYLEAPEGKGGRRDKPAPPSPWTLIFDTETRTDPGQHLRCGAYQLRHGSALVERGWFYEPATTSDSDLAVLKQAAAEAMAASEGEDVRLLTREAFVEEVFFDKAWALGGRIVGFNLPFDISRLAIKPAEPARKGMLGGFSFVLSPDIKRPHVRVKANSRHMAMIDVSSNPPKEDDGAPKPLPEPGFFVDVKTLAFALTAESHSLETLSKHLKVAAPKQGRDDHGLPLTLDYVRYAASDVEATWACYLNLEQQLSAYGVVVETHEAYSGASLGKAHLAAMRIRPWREMQPDFPAAMTGVVMSTYFGGRSEVHIRRIPTRTVLCDFLSMYPTVSTLMGTWSFLIAEGVEGRDDAAAVRSFVQSVGLDDFANRDLWRELPVLVRVKPDNDVFPVRANYGAPGEDSYSIALNHLSADEPLWFTLADVLVSKLITGRAPSIEQAIRFTPKGRQSGLAPINIMGDPALKIDPARDDFFKAVVELRRNVKRRSETPGADAETLKAQERALKVLANATGYGIFVELNVNQRPAKKRQLCHAGRAAPYELLLDEIERPGRYFHPLIATLITGAARLMLTLAERKAAANGLDWVFCDTDSLALAKPDDMREDQFIDRVHGVADWFKALNPYAFPGSILQIEDVNYEPGRVGARDGFAPLQCLAISAKRTALSVRGDDGAIDLRKGSAHGLGHIIAPYPDRDKGERRRRLKVSKWQEDFWVEIIRAAQSDTPDELDWARLPRLEALAASQYAATRPQLLRWFDAWNAGKPFVEHVKAFSFLLSFTAKSLLDIAADNPETAAVLHRRKPIAPVAPFNGNLQVAARQAFDRNTGAPVPVRALTTVAESLRRYHLHPETKFWGGDYDERGVLRRRHIHACAIELIGKETDDLEVIEFINEEAPGLVFGIDHHGAMRAAILAAAQACGQRRVCARAGVSHHRLTELRLDGEIDPATVRRLFEAGEALRLEAVSETANAQALIDKLRAAVAEKGLVRTAMELEADPSNLRKIITRVRRLSPELRRRLKPS